MIAILSGRYEIVHPGHIKTIRREAALVDLLFVMVVDNPRAATPPEWTAELLRFCVQDLNNVQVLLDPAHFGRCTKEDLDRLPPYDVFLSANDAVTNHLRGLGVNVREINQTPGYSSTEIRNRIVEDAIEYFRKMERGGLETINSR